MINGNEIADDRAALTVRLLEPREYHRLAGIPGFEALATRSVAEGGDGAALSQNLQVLIIEHPEAHTLLAAWALTMVPHAEPFWMAPTVRHHPQFVTLLLDAMQQLMGHFQLTAGAVVTTSDPGVARILTRLGCEPIGGAFVLPLVLRPQVALTDEPRPTAEP